LGEEGEEGRRGSKRLRQEATAGSDGRKRRQEADGRRQRQVAVIALRPVFLLIR